MKNSTDSKKTAGWVLVAVACVIAVFAFALLLARLFGDLAPFEAEAGKSNNTANASSSGGLLLDGARIGLVAETKLEVEAAVEDARKAIEERLTAQNAELARSQAMEAAVGSMDMSRDLRSSFDHGEKPAQFQKYIVLHDTEGSGPAESVIDWWDSSGQGVAAHFVVNKDGSIVQCVDLDKIAHHAGFGDTGHNASFGVEDESRDDKVGTSPIGSWAADYGMNSYSVGIELVHVGGEGDYPEAQLQALDSLIVYIDAYYGFESEIIDHKGWRTGNSDTSPEFASYLQNYKSYRTHSAS